MINTYDAVHVERTCHGEVGDTVSACEVITGTKHINIYHLPEFLAAADFHGGPHHITWGLCTRGRPFLGDPECHVFLALGTGVPGHLRSSPTESSGTSLKLRAAF